MTSCMRAAICAWAVRIAPRISADNCAGCLRSAASVRSSAETTPFWSTVTDTDPSEERCVTLTAFATCFISSACLSLAWICSFH